MTAVLLTSLKIMDLVALTACETGRALLSSSVRLHSLRREEIYVFEPKGGIDAGSFETPLLDAIEASNFFVNPNKERFRFVRASDRAGGLIPPDGCWGLLIRTRDDTRDVGLMQRLLLEHPLPGLGAIRRARLWWIETEGDSGGRAIDEALAALGPVIGVGRGLLYNPHGAMALRLDAAVEWGRIDSFLAAPATPFESRAGAGVRA